MAAFSDANSIWKADALTELLEPFRDPRVGYVCGRVRFVGPDGGNLEGAYWKYEMKVRELESELAEYIGVKHTIGVSSGHLRVPRRGMRGASRASSSIGSAAPRPSSRSPDSRTLISPQ